MTPFDPRYAQRWHNHDDRYETQASIAEWHKTYRPGGGAWTSSEGFGKDSDPGTLGGTAIGNAATATGTSAVAVGQSTQATGDFSVAVGQFAQATGEYSVAVGQFARATGARSGAFGHNVNSATDDTTVIKANDLVTERSNGTGATRLRLTDENGVDYWLEVDPVTGLVVTEDDAAAVPFVTYTTTAIDAFIESLGTAVDARREAFPIITGNRINTFTHGMGVRTDTLAGVSVTADSMRASLLYLPAEVSVNEIGITVTTAAASATIRLGIGTYDFLTKDATSIYDAGEVDASTTGDKTITIDQTVGPGWVAVIAFFSHAISVQGGAPATGYSYNTTGTMNCTPMQTSGTYGAFDTTENFHTNSTNVLATWLVAA